MVKDVLVKTDTDEIELKLFKRGKVRDTYDIGDTLLIVATDRISCFDVVLIFVGRNEVVYQNLFLRKVKNQKIWQNLIDNGFGAGCAAVLIARENKKEMR